MTPETFYSKIPQDVAVHIQAYVRFLTSTGCTVHGSEDGELLVDTRTFDKKSARAFLPGKSVEEISREVNARIIESGAHILQQSKEGLEALQHIAFTVYTLRTSTDPKYNTIQAQQASRAYFEMRQIPVHSATETYEDTNDFERSPIVALIDGKEALYLPPRQKVQRTRIRKDTLEARIGETKILIRFTNEEMQFRGVKL